MKIKQYVTEQPKGQTEIKRESKNILRPMKTEMTTYHKLMRCRKRSSKREAHSNKHPC